jgi:predicted ATP-dependent protease
MKILSSLELTAKSALDALPFNTTAELLDDARHRPDTHAWVAQSEAKQAALFGLTIQKQGFNVLVLGEHGTGRTSLMQSAMKEVACNMPAQLHDLVALYDFEQFGQPTLLKLPVGEGSKLRSAMDQFARELIAEMPVFAAADSSTAMLASAEAWLKPVCQRLSEQFQFSVLLTTYFKLIHTEVKQYLKVWQPPAASESDNPVEGLVNEAFFARFRVNLLVDQRTTQTQKFKCPVVYDNDPTLQSLFGTIESATDSSVLPDFLRLRAGHLHHAENGMLLLHLRDLLNDEQNGMQMIERLHRFMRNGTLQIEDDTNASGQTSQYVAKNTLLPMQVKLVMIATREDFYACMDEQPDFFEFFPIKVEFVERVVATPEKLCRYRRLCGAKMCAAPMPTFQQIGGGQLNRGFAAIGGRPSAYQHQFCVFRAVDDRECRRFGECRIGDRATCQCCGSG